MLAQRLPSLKVAGHCSPPIGPVESWDDAELSERIEAAAPQLLLAAFGCPKQEQWIARNHRSLGVPLSIGVGATLDFIVGKQQRAPKLVRSCAWNGSGGCAATQASHQALRERFGFLCKAGLQQWRDSRSREQWRPISIPAESERLGFTVQRGAWEVGGLPIARSCATRSGALLGSLFQSPAFWRRRTRAALRDGPPGASRRTPFRHHCPDRDRAARFVIRDWKCSCHVSIAWSRCSLLRGAGRSSRKARI